jgi:hypothetical protein
LSADIGIELPWECQPPGTPVLRMHSFLLYAVRRVIFIAQLTSGGGQLVVYWRRSPPARELGGQERDDRIRTTLLQYYEEVRTIPSLGVPKTGWLYQALLSEVAVLEPKKPHAPEPIAPPAASGAAGPIRKR